MLAAKGFSARFEAAAKANPDVSYTDEQFTEPMRRVARFWLGQRGCSGAGRPDEGPL